MSIPFSQPKFVATVVGSLLALALAGCGNSDSSDQPQAATKYNGSGTEALGTYDARVTKSTGLYDTGHYAPKGLTQQFELVMNGTTLTLYTGHLSGGGVGYMSSGVKMSPNPANGTYQGTASWTPSVAVGGMLVGQKITETWTMSFSGDKVILTVAGTTNTGSSIGTLTQELSEASYSYDSSVVSYYLGNITSDTGDKRFVGTTPSLYLQDNSPGTYGHWTTDYSYNGDEYFYFDSFIKNGNTLIAGGFVANTGDLSDEYVDRFATITVQLNSLGRPTSASVAVQDFDHVDDDGLIDNEPSSYTTNADSFHDYNTFFEATYPMAAAKTLHVVTVTPGGLLEQKFGIAGHDNVNWYRDQGDYVYLDNAGALNTYIHAGYVSKTQRHAVLWDKRYNDYFNTSTDYELDSSDTTNERMTIDITYTALGVATGGTVMLQVYDSVSGKLLSTENMAFTVL